MSGEGHEQAAGVHARVGCHAHDDGEHEGDGAGVAHEGADGGCHEDDEDEEAQFALSGEFQYACADHLGQPCLHDGSAYDEEADHHDDDVVGESRQGFFGCQDVGDEQGDEGAQGDDVGAYLAVDEEHGCEDEDDECCQHRFSGGYVCGRMGK